MNLLQQDSTISQLLLRRLVLSSYRNYASLRLNFSKSFVVLTGHNGAGKTNILEAISLLSPGRGLHRASYQQMNHQGRASSDPGFVVHARLECPSYGDIHIGTGFFPSRSGEGEGRKVRINQLTQPAERLLEYCRIVWHVPMQDRLLSGPAADRRRFLDRMVLAINPLHGRHVLDYEKVMRARTHLLTENHRDPIWLSALEEQMATLGVAIAAARHEMLCLLQTVEGQSLPLNEFPRSLLSLDGFLEKKIAFMPAADVEDQFVRHLNDNRSQDQIAGRALEGPHRTDLCVFHKDKSIAASLCSTGEQKALLTALILSHAYLVSKISGMTPILLFDEVAAHLDNERRRALFAILDYLGAQTFVTGTDRILFDALADHAEFFSIQDGQITAQE